MEEETHLLAEKSKFDDTNIVHTLEQDDEASWICCIPSTYISSKNLKNPSNSLVSTIMLLLNTMIGSGILAQAYVFRTAGIFVTTAAYLFVGSMTFIGVDILVKVGAKLKIFDYGELTSVVLGDFGMSVLETSIFLDNTGCLLSYVVIIGSLAQSVLETYFESSWYTGIPFLSITLMSIFVAPLCLIRKFGHLALVSYISISAITGTMILVVVGGPLDSSADRTSSLNLGSFTGLMQTVGSVVFAFGYASAVFHTYTSMTPPRSIAGFSSAALVTTGLGVVMCFLVGFVGYYSFRADTDADILQDFDGTLGAVFKLAVVIHLIFYIPGDFLILRFSLFRLFGYVVDEVSDVMYILSTLVLLGAISAVAILIQVYASTNTSLALILNLTGGIAGSFVNFILPGVFGVLVFTDESELLIKSLALTVFGCCVTLLVIGSNLYSVFTS